MPRLPLPPLKSLAHNPAPAHSLQRLTHRRSLCCPDPLLASRLSHTATPPAPPDIHTVLVCSSPRCNARSSHLWAHLWTQRYRSRTPDPLPGLLPPDLPARSPPTPLPTLPDTTCILP